MNSSVVPSAAPSVGGLMIEVWRDVPGLPFRVSTLGRVIGPRGKVLKGGLCRDGYLWAGHVIDGRRRVLSHHSLVALAFHGPRPDGYDIDHVDNNRSNNRPENLRYCTHAENMERTRSALTSADFNRYAMRMRIALKDREKPTRRRRPSSPKRPRAKNTYRPPRAQPGALNGRARLSEAQAIEILALPRSSRRGGPNGISQLSRRYGVSKVTICDLVAGRTWVHLARRKDADTNLEETENTTEKKSSAGGP